MANQWRNILTPQSQAAFYETLAYLHGVRARMRDKRPGLERIVRTGRFTESCADRVRRTGHR